MNLLLLDAGQTSIRVRRVNSEGVHDSTLSALRTGDDVIAQMVRAVTAALPLGADGVTVAVAVSGLTNGLDMASRIWESSSLLGVRQVLAVHDSVSGYLGCLGDGLGAVTAVGTGVVTLGVGLSGYSRVDGWGNLIGDAGSGYWIGRAALDAAMRAYDGRGPATALLDMMRKDFTDIEDAYIELQQDHDRVSRIARYARSTLELAERDDVARAIAVEAAAELAISISASLIRTGWSQDDSPIVSWTGGIMRNHIMAAELNEATTRHWPNARLAAPLGEPIDGVALLPELSAEHPLFPLISRAGADHLLKQR